MSYGVEVRVEKMDGKIILRIEGRLDAVSCPIVEKKIEVLIQEKQIHLLLDFNEVEYMSSAGLRFLLSFTKKMKSLQGSFVLFSLSDEVIKIVRMAGFEKVLHICRNEKEALQKK